MTREEALTLLRGGKAGVREWNRQRAGLDEVPNLSRANLRRTVLYGADLRRVILDGADLRGAVLREVNLRGADLYRADLRGAVLMMTTIRGANLYRADLRGAVLMMTTIRGANLRGARFRGATFYQTDLNGEDLLSVLLDGAHVSRIPNEFAHLSSGHSPDAAMLGLLDLSVRVPRARPLSLVLAAAHIGMLAPAVGAGLGGALLGATMLGPVASMILAAVGVVAGYTVGFGRSTGLTPKHHDG